MNLFVRLGDEVVTPPLTDTFLAGMTRDSALVLLHDWGVKVTERRVSIDELKRARFVQYPHCGRRRSGRHHGVQGAGFARAAAWLRGQAERSARDGQADRRFPTTPPGFLGRRTNLSLFNINGIVVQTAERRVHLKFGLSV